MYVPEKLFGVIGYPLGHSLSPLIHNWGFQYYSLPFVYFSWPVTPDNLPAFVLSLKTLPIHGCSITIPHKQKIIPYLDELTLEARQSQAVNTLYWQEDRLWGENTDCRGFIAPLLKEGINPDSALILGAGGASLACLTGLKRLGVRQVFMAARHFDRFPKETLSEEIRIDWPERLEVKADLLINATPLGMSGERIQETPFPREKLSNFSYVYDLVYNPLETCLLKEAQESGCNAISGIWMFIHQASLQFRLWSGQDLCLTKVYELIKNYFQ